MDKFFRFSPIENKEQLINALEYIHAACHKLCKEALGKYLPAAGNIGVFCHHDEEFASLKKLQVELTDLSKNVYGKYFKFYTPVTIPAKENTPEATYSYLYIRQPDPDKPQVGDLDFYLEPEKYIQLKQSFSKGKVIKGAQILPNRPDLDLIQLSDPNIDALGFVGGKKWQ